MIEHTFNPVFLSIGPISIRYYGLFYILGLGITYFFVRYLAKSKNIKLSDDDWLEYIIRVAFGVLIGARVFYFIFYDFSLLWNNPLELFMVWHGGMSFHGGLIGAVFAVFMFARKKKVKFLALVDITVFPVALSLAIGRIGNFINGELYGRLWKGSFCINYSTNPYIANLPAGCRYPSQIVESIKNLLIFSVLFAFKDIKIREKKLPDGTIFAGFVIMYSFLRFFIEFIREPDSQLGFVLFGSISMGQVLCAVMFIIGIVLMWVIFYLDSKKRHSSKKL
jgi:phosphatidylglycerol:prolipoprotein diacylglycerol transferase